MSESWMVVSVKIGREGWADKNILRQGLVTYLPKVVVKRPRRGVVVESTQGLFPGYMFVQSPTGRWRMLNGTFGVIRVVMQADSPALVPASEIARIKSCENADGLVVLPEAYGPRVRKGDRVRVNRGVFEGRTGVCAETAADERVRILMNFLGGQVPVLIDRGDVDIL